MSVSQSRGIRPGLLALGDGLVLVLFVLIGSGSHRSESLPAVAVRTLVPLLIAWFLFSLLLGTYRRSSFGRLALNWLLGISSGVFLRSAILGHPTGRDLFVFLGVSLGFTGVFLGIWRLAAWGLSRRSSANQSADA